MNNIAIIVLFCSISVESIRNRRNAEQTSSLSLIPISETSSIKPTTLDEFASFWARPLPNLLQRSTKSRDCDKYMVCVDTLSDDAYSEEYSSKSEEAKDNPNTTNNSGEVGSDDDDTIVEDKYLYNYDDYYNPDENYDDKNVYSVSDENDEKLNYHGTSDVTKEKNKLTETTTSTLYQQDNKEFKHSDRKENMREVHVGNTTNKIGANRALYYAITTILILLYNKLL